MKRPAAALLVAAVAVVAAPGSALAAGPADAAKVTRSADAPAGAFPGQVAVSSGGLCGGTLIDPEWVLTAAHCVVDVEAPEILLGTTSRVSGGTQVTGTAVFVHPDYDPETFDDDIALVRLPFAASAPVAPIAYMGMELLEHPGNSGVVSGWGRLSQGGQIPTLLQQGEAPVLDDAACDAAINAHGFDLLDAAYPNVVCAGAGRFGAPEEVDACQGDSGGPLWVTGPDGIRRQIGIVSWGPTCGFSPTVYTSVQAYIGFIETVTGRQFASFGDIPANAHEANIERIVLAAITGGLGDGSYGPSNAVSRGQLATFVARALGLTPVATGPFSDVAATTHAGSINAVAAAGIVGGFDDGTFRPTDLVTRAQMATFLARGRDLEPLADGPFTDLGATPHAGNINAIAAAGFATGTSPTAFSPLAPVTRAQMATFLANAFLAG